MKDYLQNLMETNGEYVRIFSLNPVTQKLAPSCSTTSP